MSVNSVSPASVTDRQPLKMVREINILVRVILDFTCLLIVGLPILILFLVGKPYQRGFYCDDESIRYPFRDSTISNTALYCVGIFIPAFFIVVTETVRHLVTVRLQSAHVFLRWRIHPLVWQLYRKIGVFAFGGFLSQLTTDIAKYSIGRLRPHFYEVCQPSINCEQSQPYEYHENFRCQNPDSSDHLLRESRLSFISGHSSFSAYTMLYLALFLQSRMTYRKVKLLRPLLQAIFIYMAWYCALSRVSDYKHHWSDVLAGSLQGTVVALITVFFISDLFQKKTKGDMPSNDSELALRREADYKSCAVESRQSETQLSS